jgi:uncharacterized membrane protein
VSQRYQPVSDTEPQPGITPEQRAELERLLEAKRAERQAARRKPLPAWLPATMKTLPYILISVTLLNLFIGLLAVFTPYLAMWFGTAVTDPIYTAYSYICPQRPSHTFFIRGHPMAFEQRDVSVHLGLAAAGLLYLVWSRIRQPLATWVAIAMIMPMLIDVAISTVGILPSTWFSRLWTGGLAGIAVVWWSYPRFDRYLRKVQDHVARLQSVRV